MELKKNPNLDVGRNSSLYFAVGLNLMLIVTYFGLNYKSYDKADIFIEALNLEIEQEEDIPIIDLNVPIPPPPPITAQSVIQVIEDIAELEETVIESTEIGQDDAIEEHIASIDEVEVDEVEEDIEVPFAVIESVPIFPGCEGNSNKVLRECFITMLHKHVQKHFRYPETAKELGVTGRVYVIFYIDTDGFIKGIRTRGPDRSMEDEAKNIITKLPRMTPGKQRGKAVKVSYSLPIMFRLED